MFEPINYWEAIILLANGLALALALAFLVIVLWYDIQRIKSQFLALFLLSVTVWSIGHVMEQLGTFVGVGESFLGIASLMTAIGFSSSSVMVYAFTATSLSLQPRYFRFLTFIGLLITIIFPLFFMNSSGLDINSNRLLASFFFFIYNGFSFYLIWYYYRQLNDSLFVTGIILFIFGQAIGFFNPLLNLMPLSVFVSSMGILIVCIAFVQNEIIHPLQNRRQQLEAMHSMSLAITSRIASNKLLEEIAEQSVLWVGGEAACIYVRHENQLELMALFGLPNVLQHMSVPIDSTLAGYVINRNESLLVESYSKEWYKQDIHLHSVASAFGSVICTPLNYDNRVIGALMVIASKQGKVFSPEDVRLLELLASQATVSISQDSFFNTQSHLASQLKAANEQLQTVLSSTENPVLALDRHLEIVFYNPSFAKLINHSESMLGKSLLQIILSKDLPPLKAVIRQIHSNGVYHHELSFKEKDFVCNIGSWGSGKIMGWVVVFNDVSELKELDRIKSEMIRMTSHDLKNPLQAATANLDLLRDDLKTFGIQDSEIMLSLDNVERQISKMQRIIGGILDLERVRLGVHLTELCDALQLAKSAVDELSDIAERKEIDLSLSFHSSSPLYFWGDKNQFERAIVNLIDNAIKFTYPRGTVVISISLQEDESILFCIADSGVGIPEELHELIFERFYRGNQKGVESVSGSGLGLSLVKSVVESHSGKIWLESTLNQGTRFFVAIPHAKPN